jgi:serine/threonine protein kinase
MSQADETDGTFDSSPISQNATFAGWKPGDIIDGKLEIQELIGKGGMGVVWRVHHREWNKELAVKMPLPALVGSPTARDRFLREAETWIDLGVHPHIVQCWFVMDISGLPSLFLDFLTGGSLKQWIDGGHVRPGQWERILDITIQVCEGLAYAHSRGVIHRDIKPANLLVRGDERICVTDFGIVKTAGSVDETPASFQPSDLPKNLSITGTGAFLGTPQYGAPEQWGSAGEVSAGADIYAVGVTLYEMCCGRRPFDTDAERMAPEVLIDRHLTTPAPDPRTFHPEIPEELARVVLQCLEKDPHKRPQTMQQLQDLLEGIYRKLVGRPYQGVGRVPSELRPDTLNNRAVSLWSLAKRDDARDIWRRGLRIESGHPECLYNLTQMDKRAGRMDAEEALRRLRQARAGLPLALLCIEEGHPEEALEVLKSLKPTASQNQGPVQRALGDALMYTQQYYAAEKAYRAALTCMPTDTFSQERKRLAALGKRSLGSRILFPSSKSVLHLVLNEPHLKPFMLTDSSCVGGVTESAVTLWNIDEECVVGRDTRPPGSSAPRRVWTNESLLLIEDQDSFELRRLPDLQLLGRKDGQVLAVARTLHRMLVVDRSGVYLFDVRQSSLSRLEFGPEMSGEGRLVSCFDQSGDQVCLLLPNGQIAQPDENNRVRAERWPTLVEDASDVTCMLLGQSGTLLYVGHASGRLQALNFLERQVQFDLRLPFSILRMELGSQSRNLVVNLEHGFVVVDRRGGVLCQGDGCAEVDFSHNRCLVFHQGHLELFDLRPFRKLRVWSQSITDPRALVLGRDARRAASLDASGRIDIWEVDEDSRVFERFFLLSPGRSFAEILSASHRFRDTLRQAQEALAREQLAAAYRQLNRARQVEGYAQFPDALDLNWRLLSVLRRGALEAVWERLNFDGAGERPGPIALSEDGKLLLVSFGPEVTLYVDTGTETRSLWTWQAKEQIKAISLLRHDNQDTALILDRQGEGALFRLSDGHLLEKIMLDRGQLEHIALRGPLAYYYRPADGAIGAYNTRGRQLLGEVQGLLPPLKRFFPYSDDTILISGEEGFGTVPLGKGKAKLHPIRLKGLTPVSELSYARYQRETSLLALGFEDGSLVLCDAARQRPVFQLSQAASGAITGFEMVADLSLGIVSTSKGQLLFFDLHSGVLLEEFSAHRGRIQQLCVSSSGRYLATAARGGHVRLWETSWTACEDESEPPLEWLPAPTTLTKISQFLGLGGKPK